MNESINQLIKIITMSSSRSNAKCNIPFTWCSRLSNQLYHENKHSTGWTTSCSTGCMNSTCLTHATPHQTGWMNYANEPSWMAHP